MAPDDASAEAPRPGGDEAGDAVDVDAAVAVLFAGPPDDFVAGRDALVRTLRAAKRRDEATEVKALRKPKAVARALNAANLHAPDAVDGLAAAVAAVNAAQDGDGDVRAALGALRDAERSVTEAALAATAGGDRAVDASTVGAAVRAVLADPDALATLRSGRLVDVPTGGGFGLAGFGSGLGTPPDTATAASPVEAAEAAEAGDRAGTDARPGARSPDGGTTEAPAGRAADRRRAGGPAGTAGRRATADGASTPGADDTGSLGIATGGDTGSHRPAAGAVTATPRGTGSRRPAPAGAGTGGGTAAGRESRPLATARRAVADAEDALRVATEAVDDGTPEVEAAEQGEESARADAEDAARRADEARERALAAARVATTARREAAARARRRDQAEAALAKARARLAKLDSG